MTTKKTNNFLISFILILAIFVGIMSNLTTAQASDTYSKAIKAYRNYLSKEKITILENEVDTYSSDLGIKIFYLNNDTIPEMLIYTDSIFGLSNTCVLYTYYKGKVIELGGGGHCGMFSSYKGTNTISKTEIGGGEYYISILNLSKGKLTSLASCSGTDDGDITVARAKNFLINDKKVSKSKFNTYFKKITKAGKNQQGKNKEITFSLTKSELAKNLK